MDYRDVKIFLSVAQTKNISRTAAELYIPQSTVSNRLKELEQYLNCSLFIRRKGKRSINLTPQGETFLDIAQEWQGVYERTEMFRRGQGKMLRFSAIDSVYNSYLREFMPVFEKGYPEINLTFRIQDSVDIYEALSKHQIDCGFVSYFAEYEGVLHRLLFSMNYYIVRHSQAPKPIGPIDIATLNPRKEIELEGGNTSQLNRWREITFGQQFQIHVKVNAIAPLLKALEEPGSWALLSCEPTAYPSLEKYTVEQQIPPKEIYYIESAQHYGFDHPVNMFKKEFFSFVNKEL